MAILMAGGERDPNLAALIASAERLRVPVIDLRVPVGSSPRFHWDLLAGKLSLEGQKVSPVAAFTRLDIFAAMEDGRPEVSRRALGWEQAVSGYLMAEGVFHLNREIVPRAYNKPAALMLAAREGLRIPTTVVSNDLGHFEVEARSDHIAKPVAGGGFCVELGQAIRASDAGGTRAPMPAILQERLGAPEVRIYVIGGAAMAFEMRSPSLDYRVRQDADVILLEDVPAKEVGGLRRLMAKLRMDFGAADFKTDPATGELVFLELNTSPMFARFDYASEGRVSAFLLEALLEGGRREKRPEALAVGAVGQR